MSAWIRSITGRAYHFVPIAQNQEQARPKRQVAGESPAGDANLFHFATAEGRSEFMQEEILTTEYVDPKSVLNVPCRTQIRTTRA